jgi:hypothetical protein
LPGIPCRSFMLDLEHCQPRCHHGWNWSRGDAATPSAPPLTRRLMRGLEPRLAEATSAHPIGRSRHPCFHHECSPCCHVNDSPLAQKSNLNHNHSISKFQFLTPFQPESGLKLNLKDLENFLIFPTVIKKPRYDKRFESYDFLKSAGLLKFWADQIFDLD